MAVKPSLPGTYCKEAGILFEDALFSFTKEYRLPKLTRPMTKGIVYELNEFRIWVQLGCILLLAYIFI